MSDHIVSYWTQFRRDKKKTDKQTNKTKQTYKQTNKTKQTYKQTNKQTNKHKKH